MHSLEEARSWIEARVDDVYGSRVGEVSDVYYDPEDCEVHWLHVRGGVSTLVPVDYSIAGDGQLWVPITKDLISRAPEFEGNRAVLCGEEIEFCFHYGGLRRRAAALRNREGVTAVPAASVLPFGR